MNRFGGGGLILLAIILVVVGIMVQSDIVEWLLNVIGTIFIVAGVIAGVVGLIGLFTGGKKQSSEF